MAAIVTGLIGLLGTLLVTVIESQSASGNDALPSPSTSVTAPPSPSAMPTVTPTPIPTVPGVKPVSINADAPEDDSVTVHYTINRPAHDGRQFWLVLAIDGVDRNNPHLIYFAKAELAGDAGTTSSTTLNVADANPAPGLTRFLQVYEVDADTAAWMEQDAEANGRALTDADARRSNPPCQCAVSARKTMQVF